MREDFFCNIGQRNKDFSLRSASGLIWRGNNKDIFLSHPSARLFSADVQVYRWSSINAMRWDAGLEVFPALWRSHRSRRSLPEDYTIADRRPASKHVHDVLLSPSCVILNEVKNLVVKLRINCAKNLIFPSWCEILPRACPELNYETLLFTQGDKAKGSGWTWKLPG